MRNLTAAQIHSDILLDLPFSNWTLSTLNTASLTLTNLSLEMGIKGDVTWKTFSRCLSLPFLKDFSLGANLFAFGNVAKFMDIEAFLMNHPSIQDLHLYRVELPPSVEAVPRPTFQNLVRFHGHPFYVEWLLRAQRAKRGETALPNLEYLRMSSDTGIFDDALFKPAFEAIVKSRKNLTLALTWNYKDGIKDWLFSHIRNGQDRECSIVSGLSNISTLAIFDSCVYFRLSMVNIIPDWLQLFPSLRHLRFECEKSTNIERLTDPTFIATVAILCPDIETMAVGGEHAFDLEQIREHLGNL